MEEPIETLKWKKEIVDKAEIIIRLLGALNFPIDFTTTGALRLAAFQLDMGREEMGLDSALENLTIKQLQEKINQVSLKIKTMSMQELDFILADQRK